jgi:predicted lipoprotein with Yx(FWY)xxD motif
VEPGSTVLHVQKAGKLGYVLAMGNGQVVYMYDKDQGGTPACTGDCLQTWLPVKGDKPAISPADTGLAALTTVQNGGVTQIVYDGHPLYVLKGAKALAATGNGMDGQWHVIKLSASNIVSGG